VSYDHKWKSPEEIIRNLIDIVWPRDEQAGASVPARF
jgi:hypothetical protein